MARKKQEIALQVEINTQDEWDDILKKEGLLVADIYQEWCGPCKAVVNFFRRIKNEIGDDFLNFAVAKADTIDSLEKYRGKCEPCFHIYGGKRLVGVVRGANPPVLETLIRLKLEEEHKVMKGEMERNETKDPYLADVETEEIVKETEKDDEKEREVTLALIKPDVVKSGKVEEIIKKLQDAGIEILAQQDRNLSEDEAKEFYHHMQDAEFFDELIKFIASGPSKILVLAKGDEGVIHDFRELIGPKILDEAKENAPQSIRAIYGTNSIENAIHGADDKDTVQRELAFFFPDFMIPKIASKRHEDTNVQRTLALIRPAAYNEYKDTIIEKINNSGFKITMRKEVQLTKEDAALFYKQHKDKPFFEELITEMSKGTLLALALEKQNAVLGWRGMLGPKDVEKAKEIDPNSMRAQFSKDDIKINLLHGSDSEDTAEIELKYFFPVEKTVAIIKPDGMENEEEIISKIHETRFRIVKSKTITLDKQLAEELYSDQRGEEYFNDLISHMQSGPSCVMILSREDAIRGWRSLIGPKDSRIAAETYPDSIRAIFGEDINKNAVYGSDNVSEAERIINLIFGHLEFNEDGTLLPEYSDEPEENQVKEQEPESSEDSKNKDETAKTDDQVDAVDSEQSHDKTSRKSVSKEGEELVEGEMKTEDEKTPKDEKKIENEKNEQTVEVEKTTKEEEATDDEKTVLSEKVVEEEEQSRMDSSKPEISEDSKNKEIEKESESIAEIQSKTANDIEENDQETDKSEASNTKATEEPSETHADKQSKEGESAPENDQSQIETHEEENETTLNDSQIKSENEEKSTRSESKKENDMELKDKNSLDNSSEKVEDSEIKNTDSKENEEDVTSVVESNENEESLENKTVADEGKVESTQNTHSSNNVVNDDNAEKTEMDTNIEVEPDKTEDGGNEVSGIENREDE